MFTLKGHFGDTLGVPVCEFLHISPEAVTSERNFCLHNQTVSNPLASMAQNIFPKILQHH